MPDTLTPQQRSATMSHVRNRNTKPEMLVRSVLHRMGYRFRLHDRTLPGTPDIVLRRHRKIVQVNGCFWHGHSCSRGKRPSSNAVFWDTKITQNQERDRKNLALLEQLGWQVLVVWECELRNLEELTSRLTAFIEEDHGEKV